MKNLVFSFIIPAHNEEKVIGSSLESIKKQESKKNYEIIVINDGSKDKTLEIVKKYKDVRLINFKDGHSAAFARNRGAEKAKGEYLIFLDADQILENGFLDKLNMVVGERKFNVAAFRIHSASPKSIFQRGWHAYRKYNKCAAIIIKRKLFNEIKYREDLFYVEDDVLFEEAIKRGNKLEETGAFVYHIDPKTLKDYWRQRKWQGRGLVMKIFLLKKYWAFRHFIPCLIIPLTIITPYIIIAYLAGGFIFFTMKTKEPINSLLWILTDFAGRYISLFYFLVYSLAAGIKGKII
ncbi:MAG: glycosyltransferase [Nanoarchaeota archaeon]